MSYEDAFNYRLIYSCSFQNLVVNTAILLHIPALNPNVWKRSQTFLNTYKKMTKTTEYQCFRKLLEEVFEVFSGRKEAYKMYGDADYKELIKDLNQVLQSGQSLSITTLKSHLKLKETSKGFPRISNLNLYCKYCKLKGSDWCQTEKWHLLLEENKASTEEENKASTEEENKGNAKEEKIKKVKNAIFTHVWYTAKVFKRWSIRTKDNEGVLFVEFDKQQMRFESEITNLLIKSSDIEQVLLTKMPNDIANSWVRVIYKNKKSETITIWFQDKSKASGLSSMFGGSKELYKLLYHLMTESKP